MEVGVRWLRQSSCMAAKRSSLLLQLYFVLKPGKVLQSYAKLNNWQTLQSFHVNHGLVWVLCRCILLRSMRRKLMGKKLSQFCMPTATQSTLKKIFRSFGETLALLADLGWNYCMIKTACWYTLFDVRSYSVDIFLYSSETLQSNICMVCM
jgi:hypothetical protein